MTTHSSHQVRSAPAADAPLHVVHVVLSMTIGGLERNVLNQVREGQKLGQRVSLVCLDEPGLLAPQVLWNAAEIGVR